MRQLRPSPMRTARAGLAAALVLALAGCTGGKSHPSATGTPAKPGPSQSASPPIKDGHFTFTLLSLHCRIMGVTGTHSEATPDGQFCVAVLRIHNDDQDFHDYVANQQKLEGVTGKFATPDGFAMGVRRQNPTEKVGGSDLMELELWYDVPLDAKITGLRVMGDHDAVSYLDDTPVPYAPNGVLIPMTPIQGY